MEQLSADDDTISFAYRVVETHLGKFMNIAATGTTINICSMQISKFKEGKMVERWEAPDELELLKQLGVNFSKTSIIIDRVTGQ